MRKIEIHKFKINSLILFILWVMFIAVLLNFKIYSTLYVSYLVVNISYVLFFFILIFKKNSLPNLNLLGVLIIYFCLSNINGVITTNELISLVKYMSLFFVYTVTYKLLKYKYLTVKALLQNYFIFILIAVSAYLYQGMDLFINLDIDENRFYPEWIGGYNQFSFLIGMAVPVGVFIFKPYPYFRLVAIMVLVVAMLLTMSRGGLLALLFGMLIYKFMTRGLRIKQILWIFIGLILVSAMDNSFLTILVDRFYESLVAGDMVTKTSGRNFMWEYAWNNIFYENSTLGLFFGRGIGSFYYENFTDPHSTPLLLLWEFGVVGLIFFMIVFIKNYLKLSWKSCDSEQIILKTMLIIILINLSVESLHFSSQSGWLLAVLLAAVTYKNNNKSGIVSG